MANVTTNPRYWILDTAAVINVVGTKTIVRKILYIPAAVDNEAIIYEYIPAGTAVEAMRIKAGPSVALPVEIDFGPDGRSLNGFRLYSITAGALYVYIGKA